MAMVFISGGRGFSSFMLLLMLGVHGAAAFTAPATYMPVCDGRCGVIHTPLLMACPLSRFCGRLARW